MQYFIAKYNSILLPKLLWNHWYIVWEKIIMQSDSTNHVALWCGESYIFVCRRCHHHTIYCIYIQLSKNREAEYHLLAMMHRHASMPCVLLGGSGSMSPQESLNLDSLRLLLGQLKSGKENQTFLNHYILY